MTWVVDADDAASLLREARVLVRSGAAVVLAPQDRGVWASVLAAHTAVPQSGHVVLRIPWSAIRGPEAQDVAARCTTCAEALAAWTVPVEPVVLPPSVRPLIQGLLPEAAVAPDGSLKAELLRDATVVRGHPGSVSVEFKPKWAHLPFPERLVHGGAAFVVPALKLCTDRTVLMQRSRARAKGAALPPEPYAGTDLFAADADRRARALDAVFAAAPRTTAAGCPASLPAASTALLRDVAGAVLAASGLLPAIAALQRRNASPGGVPHPVLDIDVLAPLARLGLPRVECVAHAAGVAEDLSLDVGCAVAAFYAATTARDLSVIVAVAPSADAGDGLAAPVLLSAGGGELWRCGAHHCLLSVIDLDAKVAKSLEHYEAQSHAMVAGAS